MNIPISKKIRKSFVIFVGICLLTTSCKRRSSFAEKSETKYIAHIQDNLVRWSLGWDIFAQGRREITFCIVDLMHPTSIPAHRKQKILNLVEESFLVWKNTINKFSEFEPQGKPLIVNTRIDYKCIIHPLLAKVDTVTDPSEKEKLKEMLDRLVKEGVYESTKHEAVIVIAGQSEIAKQLFSEAIERNRSFASPARKMVTMVDWDPTGEVPSKKDFKFNRNRLSHEMGHLLGLLDTYVQIDEKNLGQDEDQPPSLMQATSNEFSQDDADGIRAIYESFRKKDTQVKCLPPYQESKLSQQQATDQRKKIHCFVPDNPSLSFTVANNSGGKLGSQNQTTKQQSPLSPQTLSTEMEGFCGTFSRTIGALGKLVDPKKQEVQEVFIIPNEQSRFDDYGVLNGAEGKTVCVTAEVEEEFWEGKESVFYVYPTLQQIKVIN